MAKRVFALEGAWQVWLAANRPPTLHEPCPLTVCMPVVCKRGAYMKRTLRTDSLVSTDSTDTAWPNADTKASHFELVAIPWCAVTRRLRCYHYPIS
jgi:hypothetical protein